MTQSDDLTHKVHDIDELDENTNKVNNHGDPLTPEDEDDNFNEGADKDTSLDQIHDDAFGDEDNLPIDKEIDKDEISRVKDLDEDQQEPEE